MNWKQWADWKERDIIAVMLFVLAYLLTIPIRDYGFLEPILGAREAVPVWAHLAIIVIASAVLVILLEIIAATIRHSQKK